MQSRTSETWTELLSNRARTAYSETAYIFLADGEAEHDSITYGELEARARAVAAVLQAQGAEGETVLLLYPPGLDYIVGFFACLYAGAIAVPLYPPRNRRKAETVAAIALDSGAKLALTVDSERKAARTKEVSLPRELKWVATDTVPADKRNDWVPTHVNGSTVAYLQYTSGSTSIPKGVTLDHRTVFHQCSEIGLSWATAESSVMVSWLPHYHDFGQVFGILQPIYQGFMCVLMAPAAFVQRPIRWLKAISRYKATHSAAPNFAFDLCVDSIPSEERKGLDLSSWKSAPNGAEPVRKETIDRFSNAFVDSGYEPSAMNPSYGLAEATLKVTANNPGSLPSAKAFDREALLSGTAREAPNNPNQRWLVSCGTPVLQTTVTVVDPETGEPCPEDTVGEVWVKSPCVARGYWRRDEETARTFHARLENGDGPYLRTGDLGFLNGGELYICSRLKDLIVIRGDNHYPQDIELTVEESDPSLRKGFSAAFRIEERDREGLGIMVERKRYCPEASEPSEVLSKIRKAVANNHGIEVSAIALLKTGTIPKTSSGKIQRTACREMLDSPNHKALEKWRSPRFYMEGNNELPDSQASKNALLKKIIVDVIVSTVSKQKRVPESSIDVAASLAEQGLDSVDMLELHGVLSDWFKKDIPSEWMWDSDSIDQLASNISLQDSGLERSQTEVVPRRA